MLPVHEHPAAMVLINQGTRGRYLIPKRCRNLKPSPVKKILWRPNRPLESLQTDRVSRNRTIRPRPPFPRRLTLHIGLSRNAWYPQAFSRKNIAMYPPPRKLRLETGASPWARCFSWVCENAVFNGASFLALGNPPEENHPRPIVT